MQELTAVRETIRDAIKPHTDHKSAMDSGGGMGSVDLWFWMGGTEYVASIKKVRSKPVDPKTEGN